jgi:polysaccharide biosynthesis protein PelA
LALGRRLLAITLAIMAGGTAWAGPSPAGPLGGVKTWAVYYGEAPETAADLARFDLVVLDPSRHPPLSNVKRHGALLLMYVSLGEVNVHSPVYTSIAAAPWVLAPNPNWPEARRLDPRAPAYERWLLDQVVPAALAGPVNGLFLDTADTAIELERAEPGRYAGAGEALERVLRALHRAHPRALLVLNGGLPLVERTRPLLAGVAVESILTDYDFKAQRYRARESEAARERMAALRRVTALGLPVLALEYAPPDDAVWRESLIARARAAGLVPYISTIGLDKVFIQTLR